MARNRLTVWALGVFCAAGIISYADTFKNKETGEVFYGFRTTKVAGGKTLVYNEESKKTSPVDLSGYDVVLDEKGRRNSYVQIAITSPEVLLSTNITKTLSDAILKAANTGPRFVLLKIDNPGGRGENMKEICSTISKIDTCPIAAYISGGTYGGAHSAAAAVALACDKIYISPTASISAVGPFVTTGNNLDSTGFLKTFSPDSLASYGTYIATLAEAKQRPAILAKAMLDKRLALVEATDTDGTTVVVEKSARQPTQTVVKTLCEGAGVNESNDAEKSTGLNAEVIHSQVLTLTASDAVRLKLADGIAESVQAVAELMGAKDATLANAPGIDSMVKQFAAAKRNVGRSLSRIRILEDRAATLEEQINTLEENLRTNPTTVSQTREKNKNFYSRSRRLGYEDSGYYYYDEQRDSIDTGSGTTIRDENGRITTTSDGMPITSRRNPERTIESETRTTSEAPEAAMETRRELGIVLDELVGEYQRTIAAAQRWGGVLPPELTIQTLQSNRQMAIELNNSLDYR